CALAAGATCQSFRGTAQSAVRRRCRWLRARPIRGREALMTDKPWPVLVQVNATSLVDEGTSNVFDILQEKAAPTGFLVVAHGFNPEVVDRGKTWPGHGPRGSNSSLGGYFATVHEQYYRGTTLGSPRVRDAAFEGFDVMDVAGREAKARGLSLHVYILESAG